MSASQKHMRAIYANESVRSTRRGLDAADEPPRGSECGSVVGDIALSFN
jgi:hypothetical protein